MSVSRRDLLTVGTLGVVAVGCSPLAQRLTERPKALTVPTRRDTPNRRLIDRLTFGPRPGDLEEVASLGHETWIRRELVADRPETLPVTLQIRRLDALWMDPHEMWDLPENMIVGQLQQAGILRAAHGTNGLSERLADFWTNHFNIYGRKGLSAFRIGRVLQTAIRPNVLGNFGTMLRAVAHNPAMLVYLDNQVNVEGVPNENYARELMELHTLGVHGGYTQKDVREVARCFTGWSMERRFLHKKGAFVFNAERHDNGEKHVLGHRIPAGQGQADADQVLDILANHPETAKFVCGKLARAFVGEDARRHIPAMSQRFLASNGDIRHVLGPLLLDRAILDSPPIYKRPFDYLASAIRVLGGFTDGSQAVQDHLGRMGQPLYQWPMPDGFPNEPEAWAGSTLGRWNFALALTNGGIKGTSLDWPALEAPSPALITRAVTGHPDVPYFDGTAAEATALALCAPEFQWR